MVRLEDVGWLFSLYSLSEVQSHHTDHYEEEYDHAHHDEPQEHPQHVHLDKINEVRCFLTHCCCLTHFNLTGSTAVPLTLSQ